MKICDVGVLSELVRLLVKRPFGLCAANYVVRVLVRRKPADGFFNGMTCLDDLLGEG